MGRQLQLLPPGPFTDRMHTKTYWAGHMLGYQTNKTSPSTVPTAHVHALMARQALGKIGVLDDFMQFEDQVMRRRLRGVEAGADRVSTYLFF